MDKEEPGPGGPQQWECLQLSVEYDFGSQEVRGPEDVRDFGGAMGEGLALGAGLCGADQEGGPG